MWAEPRKIDKLEDCYFYHTMDLPVHGTVFGEWDLRGKESAYLGNTTVAGKRVLDVGTASGHLCFAMEKMGAEVVAYDLSDRDEWDIVPYATEDFSEHIQLRKKHINLMNNGYWFAHQAFSSKSKVAYGRIYDIPESLGKFEIALVGSILLHLRDPFLALQKIANLVSDTIIVTDVLPGQRNFIESIIPKFPYLRRYRQVKFLPDASRAKPLETWWNLSPHLVCEILKVLGFPHVEISYHRQLGRKNKVKKMFTVTGKRT
jgi:SAM-dependent methyltransferase